MFISLNDALDKSGVQIFWEKIKNFFVTKEEAEEQFLTQDDIDINNIARKDRNMFGESNLDNKGSPGGVIYAPGLVPSSSINTEGNKYLTGKGTWGNPLQIASQTTGSLNLAGNSFHVTCQTLIETSDKAKYIEFFDSKGALAISATIDSNGTTKNICTRCGRIVKLNSDVGTIEVNVTTALGSPAYYKVYIYDQ